MQYHIDDFITIAIVSRNTKWPEKQSQTIIDGWRYRVTLKLVDSNTESVNNAAIIDEW